MTNALERPAAPPLPEPSVDVKKTHEVAAFKHGIALTTCQLDPTGRYAFAGAEDFNVYRWEVAAGLESKEAGDKSKTIFRGHESWVRSLAFSPDGEFLYTAGYDDCIGVWHVNSAAPKPIKMIKAHDGWVRWVRVEANGKRMVSCGNDNLLKLWSLPDGKLIREFAGHERYPYAVVFHPDGQQLASFDLMGNLKEWDIASGKEVRSIEAKFMWGFDQKFRADMGGARDMTFSDDGKTLAIAGLTEVTNAFAGVHKPMILLVDWKSGKFQHKFKDDAYKGMAWGVRFHSDGFLIGVGAPQSGNKGMVWFWKPGDKKAFHSVQLSHCGRGLDMTSDDRRIAVAQFDGQLKLYDLTAKA